MPSCNWFLRLIPLLVMLPAALLLSEDRAVSGQDGLPAIGEIRDLAVKLRVRRTGDIELSTSVRNNSPITMRNIQVRLTADPPLAFEALNNPLGAGPDDFDPATNIWTIPELAAGDTWVLYFQPLPGSTPQYVTVQAEIIGSIPAEGAANLADSQSVEWWVHVEAATTAGEKRKQLVHNAQLFLNLDNRYPEPGQIPVFKVSIADINQGTRTFARFDQADVVVKVALSEGLAFAGAPSPPSGTTFSETSLTAGVWRLGRGGWEPGTLSIPVRLTSDAGAAPALTRRCLTAQIVDSIPPPSAVTREEITDISETAYLTAKTHNLCLGKRKSRVFSLGEVRISPATCLSVDNPVCPGEKTTGVSAVIPGAGGATGTSNPPEDLVILVDPAPLANPVTIGGTTYPWATGHAISTLTNDVRFAGPRLIFRTRHKDQAFSRKFTISDIATPGTMAIIDRYVSGDQVILEELLNPDKSDKLTYTINDNWGPNWPYIALFSEPGVYKVNLGIQYTGKTGYSDFSETAPFTFAVGLLGDLQVHDAGLHDTLPRGQQAYTLRAENNLEETAEEVEVALTGVPQGAKAEVSEDGGSYERGDCDINGLCSGIWKIGDLEGQDYRHLSGRSDGPTLTLLVDGEARPITATITSEQTQTVTADGKSYTIEVIDLDDSNSKDVSVAVGTGRGEPDPEAPQHLRVDRLGSAALVRWSAVEDITGWPAAYYQVERDNQILDVEAKQPLYLDLAASGNAFYRVRAVNEFGDPGPWARPSGGLPPPSVPRDFRAELITDTDVALTWQDPEIREAMTHYTIQASDHVGGPWSSLTRPNADATRWVHSNLPQTGATKHYRIRAHNRSNHSAWAEASVQLATPPEGATPSSLRAQRYTTRQGNHGIQVWFTARYTCDLDATDCLTLIEFREVGGSAWRFGSENFGEYGIVPWDPDADYFTQGDGRGYVVRLDTAYDIRVCKLTEEQLEAKHKQGKAEGTWCVGHPTGQLRVPAGE